LLHGAGAYIIYALSLAGASVSQVRRELAVCGKTQPEGLCNKGTALAGPIKSAE
jgi:hypothetical protein